MHIAGMHIHDFPPFTRRLEFKFHERVNLLAGPNSSGKSTVLRVLGDLAATSRDYEQPMHTSGNYHFQIFVSDDWPQEWTHERDEILPAWDKLPIVGIPATRIGLDYLRDPLDPDEMLAEPEKITVHFASYLSTSVSSRFVDGKDVAVASQRLADEARKTPPSEDARSGGYANFEKAMRISYNCARSICSEILIGRVPDNFIANERQLRDLSEHSADVRIGMAVDTVDTNGLEVHSLSSGTQGVLLWIRFLALQILYHYEFMDGWEDQPAILLIDEIENHLHPTWQRRVIPALLDHFPGLQIFATTHSPFVVAGRKKGQVHLLKRDENGVVSTTTNQQDIIGWTADEILRVFMGVGEPTDEHTANAGAELRRLRDMGTLADEHEEEQRQERIRELRGIVNIAVLDGPRAAEDARFTENLTRILERYRLSRDLNQENG